MLHNPRWYETIMLKSGNLDGDERISFIDKISEQNLYLAAKCKNSSFEQEPILVKRLLQKARKETEDINDAKNAAQGILTLAEFACEKEIVKLTINLAFEKLFAIYEVIDHFGLKPPMILSDLLVLKTPMYNYDYSYELTYDYEQEIDISEEENEGEIDEIGEYKENEILKRVYHMTRHNIPNFQKIFSLVKQIIYEDKTFKLNFNAYNILINKAQTYQQGFDLFEEMKQAVLTPNVVTFNTLLKKATQYKQPLQVFLSLLDEMINQKIKPQVGSINKKGKKIKPYTVFAVENKLRKSQKPYKEWIQKKREQLKEESRGLQTAWIEFFRQTSEFK